MQRVSHSRDHLGRWDYYHDDDGDDDRKGDHLGRWDYHDDDDDDDWGKQDMLVCCSLHEYGDYLPDHPDYDHGNDDHLDYDADHHHHPDHDDAYEDTFSALPAAQETGD